jgi:hypothetical protein
LPWSLWFQSNVPLDYFACNGFPEFFFFYTAIKNIVFIRYKRFIFELMFSTYIIDIKINSANNMYKGVIVRLNKTRKAD